MNKEQKLAWLEQYRENERELWRLNQEIDHWREVAQHASRGMSAAPGNKGGNRLQRAVEKIVLLQDSLGERLLERLAMRDEFEAVVARLSSPRHAEVLRLRYLNGEKWTVVASEMRYSKNHVIRLCNEAVELLPIPEAMAAPVLLQVAGGGAQGGAARKKEPAA